MVTFLSRRPLVSSIDQKGCLRHEQVGRPVVAVGASQSLLLRPPVIPASTVFSILEREQDFTAVELAWTIVSLASEFLISWLVSQVNTG
jgi:hypothetical protein